MKTGGIGPGADYTAASRQEKKEKQKAADYDPAKEREAYARKPAAKKLGQESVMDSFQRMTQSCNGAYRAMAMFTEELSDRTEQSKSAMEKIWNEYDAQIPEEDRADAVEKTETESKIIVKPDGSRVLVITTITNGVITSVKSMEISEPTDAPNESGQEGESEAEQEGEAAGLEGAASELEGMAEEGDS